jgi:1-piperideine-2-carboxylate/1-pyrroline-2-carboxylate reductase [NAD(P)H]
MKILDARATADALAWPALIAALEATIRDSNAGATSCPPRSSLPLTQDAVWLLMPARSSRADIAACKLVTVHPGNRALGLPTIQGDVLVIRAGTGERLLLLDGPTVTARRTAAVTALAIRRIREARHANTRNAPGASENRDRPLICLIIGCGVQGRSHLEALAATLPMAEFLLSSRSAASAQRLADHATASGIPARTVVDVTAVLPIVDLVVTSTEGTHVCLQEPPADGAIIAAIGSFRPDMSELGPAVMQAVGRNILLDSADAGHEAGELFQAGIDPRGLPDLFTWTPQSLPAVHRTVLFKSCGNALWDLAAALAATG